MMKIAQSVDKHSLQMKEDTTAMKKISKIKKVTYVKYPFIFISEQRSFMLQQYNIMAHIVVAL